MKSFIFRWLFSTNHEDRGTLYFFFGTFAGIIGTLVSVLIRLELFTPRDSMLNGNFQYYNVLVTANALFTKIKSIILTYLKLFLETLQKRVLPLFLNTFSNWVVKNKTTLFFLGGVVLGVFTTNLVVFVDLGPLFKFIKFCINLNGVEIFYYSVVFNLMLYTVFFSKNTVIFLSNIYYTDGITALKNEIKENGKNFSLAFLILWSNLYFLSENRSVFALNLIILYFLFLDLGLFLHRSTNYRVFYCIVFTVLFLNSRILPFLYPKIPFIVWGRTSTIRAVRELGEFCVKFMDQNPKFTTGLVGFGLAVGTIHLGSSIHDFPVYTELNSFLSEYDYMSAQISLKEEYSQDTFSLKKERVELFKKIMEKENELWVPRFGVFKSFKDHEILNIKGIHNAGTITKI
jgi:hypothetical protein